jgi:hypothetical protein
MKYLILFFAILSLLSQPLIADPSEDKAAKVPLGVHSWGLNLGAVYSLTDSLRAQSEQHFKLSISNLIFLNERTQLFLDIDWFLPGSGNFGGDIGFDYHLAEGALRPLIGLGAGLHNMDKGNSFGQDFGPSATVHAGFLLDLTDILQIRVRVPYHLITNADWDQGVGLDVGFLFSSAHRNVKRLRY